MNRGPLTIRARNPWERLKHALYWVVGGMAALLLGLVVGFQIWAPQLVDTFNRVLAESDNNTLIYDTRDGLVATIEGRQDRHYVPIARIHTYLQKAVVAVEDHRFFAHRGMDPIRLAKAVWVDLQDLAYSQGGSTITQQLVKLTLLSSERSLARKIKEIFMAFAVEGAYSKLKVLEFYLNRVYLGKGVYGVEKAARVYFHKSAAELSLAEASLLAALIKKPEGYLEEPARPPGEPPPATLPLQHLKPLLARQQLILNRLYRQRWVTPAEFQNALRQQPVMHRPVSEPVTAPYFVEHVKGEVRALLGVPRVSGGGFRVYTTLDPQQQAHAEALVEETVRAHPEAEQAGIVALEPGTGFVRALVGGVDFTQSQFNRVTQARRQPGSAFKPLVFAAALDNGFGVRDVFLDEPVRYAWGDPDAPPPPPLEAGPDGDTAPPGEPAFYEPRNFNDRYGALRGAAQAWVPVERRMTLARALELSSNVVAVQLLNKLGISPVVRLVRRLGITLRPEMGLCIALGCSELSLLELTAAYAPFANGGLTVRPVFIRKVLGHDGEVLYEHRPPPPEQVISPWTAFRMSRLLGNVLTHGTGRGALLDRPAGGKTGTNDGPRDTWFVGFTPELVTGTWLGNDDNRIMPNETGGRTTARLWRRFMTRVLPPYAGEGFPEPDGDYLMVRTCMISGDAAGDWCPLTRLLPFLPHEAPQQVCQVHGPPGMPPPEWFALREGTGLSTEARLEAERATGFTRNLMDAFRDDHSP